jgi:hypothetical protein
MPEQHNPHGFTDDEVIVLKANGQWIADGYEITHEPTRKLFARSLFKDEQGYYLHIGREVKRIAVEDTAYFVHRVEGDPTRGIRVVLNDDAEEPLDPATLSYRPGRLVCRVTRRGDSEEARFLHAPYFDLLQHLEEDGSEYFLRIAGKKAVLSHK